ncbi:MAG TPA: ClpXP protease specificity-enhancing factor SspB [Acidiphilium sp.]
MAEDDDTSIPDSLLPYDAWTEEALRLVVQRALQHAEREGLPGNHHFYITFRTAHSGVIMPDRLRAQYPEEMTIVLQHQFRDLTVDPVEEVFTVKLSFGGIPSTLTIPLAAVTAFADPEVRFGLQFTVSEDETAPEPEVAAPEPPEPRPEPSGPADVVSLDAFRRRPPAKD